MAWVDEAPDPPVVAKVTHVSIELSWDNSVLNEKNTFTPVTNKSKFRYVVQEEEVGGLVTKGYGIVYSGFAHKNIFTGLEPRTMYRYRVKKKYENKETPWSRPIEVSTTKKPCSVDDLQKVVLRNDINSVHSVLRELKKDLIDSPDKFGYSALMTAAMKGFTSVAEVLIEHYADVNFQNSGGKNALMMACYGGHLEIVKLLCRHGANWHCLDNSGCTPLHWAVDGGNVELVRWMVNNDCQIDTKDRTAGWTPLMRLASTSGNLQVARILVHKGADVNVLDNDRRSVLMIASLNGHASLVKLLLAKGARTDLKSSHSKTALDFARSFDHRQIIQMLEEE